MKRSKLVVVVLILLSFAFVPKVFASTNKFKVDITLEFSDKTKKIYNTEKGSINIYVNFIDDSYDIYIDGREFERIDFKAGKNDFIRVFCPENYIYTTYIEIMNLTDECEFVKEDSNGLGIDLRYIKDRYFYLEDRNGEEFCDERVNEDADRIIVDLQIRKTAKKGISGVDTVFNNVSKPYTTEEITKIAGISAYDDYDGNISHLIKIKDDGYTLNKNKLGVYKITYEVTNKGKLTSTFTLNVINKDIEKPYIEGENKITFGYNAGTTLDTIVEMYKAIDNYDTDVEVKVESSNFVEGKIGAYHVTLSATDSSNNERLKVISVVIVDNVKPYFVDENEGNIKINFKDEITDELLIQGLKAEDEIDGNLTSRIKVVEKDIKPILGLYTVKYEVRDDRLNLATHERVFEVVTSDAPIFWVSTNLLSIEDFNNLSIEEIMKLIAEYEDVLAESYEVILDEYSENSTKAGKYNVSFKAIDTNQNLHYFTKTINIFTRNNKETVLEEVDSSKELLFVGISIITMGVFVTLYQLKRKR